MSDVRVTTNHRRRAEEILGGTATELAEEDVGCSAHDTGYYESGGNVFEACEICGQILSDPIPHDDLPNEYSTFERDSVQQEYRADLSRSKSYHEGRIEDKAEEIAKEDIYRTASQLTPAEDASAGEWKQAFEQAPNSDVWQMLRNAYMKSDAWAQRKQAKRESYDTPPSCAAQLPGCSGDYDHTHHKSYDNIGCEPLWDLEPVCHHCHDVLHGHKSPEPTSETDTEVDVSYEDLYGTPALEAETNGDLPF